MQVRCSDVVSDNIRQGLLLYSPPTLVPPMLPAFNAPQWNRDETGEYQQTTSNDERRRV